MQYVCDAPGGKTCSGSRRSRGTPGIEMMRHVVEQSYRREQGEGRPFRPRSNVFFEQGPSGAHPPGDASLPDPPRCRRQRPRDRQLPPRGREDRSFRTIIVGRENDPYLQCADAIKTLARHYGIALDGPVATRIAAIEAAELRGTSMSYDLRAFASAAHDILAGAPGPEGRQRVCDLMRDALRDPGFVASVLGDATPERQILYEDPELGFCILAHNYKGAKQSPPHDHGRAGRSTARRAGRR